MTIIWSNLLSRSLVNPQNNALFDALFQQYWNRICEMLYRMTGDWHEAEDLALETFLRLYQQPPVDDQNLPGWVYRVAANLGLNALRASRRRSFYEAKAAQDFAVAGEYSADPAKVAEQQMEAEQVRVVLRKMKSRSAQMLVLRHSGLSYAEIAAALDIAASSVGTLLARAEREFEQKYQAIEWPGQAQQTRRR